MKKKSLLTLIGFLSGFVFFLAGFIYLIGLFGDFWDYELLPVVLVLVLSYSFSGLFFGFFIPQRKTAVIISICFSVLVISSGIFFVLFSRLFGGIGYFKELYPMLFAPPILIPLLAVLSSFLHPRIFKVALEEEAEKEIIVSTEPEKK